MERKTYRKIQNLMLFFTLLVLSTGFYIENTYSLVPCPLCLMQRFCIFMIGFFCLVGYGLGSIKRARFIAIIQIVLSIIALYFASRQIWLQSLPVEQGQMCMPGAAAIAQYFSKGNIIETFFWGSSTCSEVTWKGLGLSMPIWSAIYFSMMSVVNAMIIVFLSISVNKKSI